jgi:hypothetical protein
VELEDLSLEADEDSEEVEEVVELPDASPLADSEGFVASFSGLDEDRLSVL